MTEVGAYETSQSIPGDISNNDDMEGGSDHTNSSSSDTSAELEVKCTRCKLVTYQYYSYSKLCTHFDAYLFAFD